MPSRRDLIRMSDIEIRQYLDSQRRVILVTNGPEGLPHPVPMEYGRQSDGTFLITSFRKSQKVVNLQRDPRATLLFESGVEYHELKSVIAYCNVEIVQDADLVRQLMRQLKTSEALSASMSEAMSAQVQASIAKRVILCLKPFRFVSWDHSKLEKHY